MRTAVREPTAQKLDARPRRKHAFVPPVRSGRGWDKGDDGRAGRAGGRGPLEELSQQPRSVRWVEPHDRPRGSDGRPVVPRESVTAVRGLMSRAEPVVRHGGGRGTCCRVEAQDSVSSHGVQQARWRPPIRPGALCRAAETCPVRRFAASHTAVDARAPRLQLRLEFLAAAGTCASPPHKNDAIYNGTKPGTKLPAVMAR